MILTLSISVVLGFTISYVFRMMRLPLWICYIVPCIITGVVLSLASLMIDGLYENPISVFENFRAIFICFIGAGVAELYCSLKEDLGKTS